MTITQCIESVSDWLAVNVCSKIKLKKAQDKNVNDYEEVNPQSFAMFSPGRDKLPPNAPAVFPSVVTQLIEGADKTTENSRRLKLQLSFTAWNPGTHPQEQDDKTVTTMQPNADGWKDVWNFVEKALEALENKEYIGAESDKLRVVKELGITFGQFTNEQQISDLYPYWGAWIILTIERGLPRTGEPYNQYL